MSATYQRGHCTPLPCCEDGAAGDDDPCQVHRAPWNNNFRFQCMCYSTRSVALLQRERIYDYIHNQLPCVPAKLTKVTRFIADEKGYLIPPEKEKAASNQKRPLWGVPQTQWDIDEEQGLHKYKSCPTPTEYSPRTPLPTFFQPLDPISPEVCEQEDKSFEEEEREETPNCQGLPPCRRRVLRAVYRYYKGKHPRKSEFEAGEPGVKDDALEQTELMFVDFLLAKAPIVWIYGRPVKSVEETRRKYCLNLAETHGFAYISLDEEVALLSAAGARAIEKDNHNFEGFKPPERLALPMCLKLVKEKEHKLDRADTMTLIKYLMLKYYPSNGYILDGYPYNEEDNREFEEMFYPIACGLYFMDTTWTSDKSTMPDAIQPLYFRRDVKYSELDVEEACGKFGLKTLKVIAAEKLLDDEDKMYALHAILDEYFDAYEEVLLGNEEVLRDDNLEYQTFGETVGYGLNLEGYIRRPRTKEQKEAREKKVSDDNNKSKEISPHPQDVKNKKRPSGESNKSKQSDSVRPRSHFPEEQRDRKKKPSVDSNSSKRRGSIPPNQEDQNDRKKKFSGDIGGSKRRGSIPPNQEDQDDRKKKFSADSNSGKRTTIPPNQEDQDDQTKKFSGDGNSSKRRGSIPQNQEDQDRKEKFSEDSSGIKRRGSISPNQEDHNDRKKKFSGDSKRRNSSPPNQDDQNDRKESFSGDSKRRGSIPPDREDQNNQQKKPSVDSESSKRRGSIPPSQNDQNDRQKKSSVDSESSKRSGSIPSNQDDQSDRKKKFSGDSNYSK